MACSNHLQSSTEAKIFVKIEVEKHCNNVIIGYYGSLYISFLKSSLSFEVHLSDKNQHRHKKIFWWQNQELVLQSVLLFVCMRMRMFTQKTYLF